MYYHTSTFTVSFCCLLLLPCLYLPVCLQLSVSKKLKITQLKQKHLRLAYVRLQVCEPLAQMIMQKDSQLKNHWHQPACLNLKMQNLHWKKVSELCKCCKTNKVQSYFQWKWNQNKYKSYFCRTKIFTPVCVQYMNVTFKSVFIKVQK